MSRVHRVATVQFEPTMFEKARNMRGCSNSARRPRQPVPAHRHAGEGPQALLVRPAEVAPFVETIPGPTTDGSQRSAKTRLLHRRRHAGGRQRRNLFQLCGVDRTRRCGWPASQDAHPIFRSRNGPRRAISAIRSSTPDRRIALLICMDIHFVETARLVALQGADVICHISNWLAERAPGALLDQPGVRERLLSDRKQSLGLERTVQFSGGSCVIAPTEPSRR